MTECKIRHYPKLTKMNPGDPPVSGQATDFTCDELRGLLTQCTCNKYENKAIRTLTRGGPFIREVWTKYKPDDKLSGEDAMKLSNLYGLNLSFIAILAYTHNMSVDIEEYNRLLEIEQSRKIRPCPANMGKND